jgi:ABC-3C biological conflict system middle component
MRRPAEIRTLLNPAFCSLLLREAAKSYAARTHTELPVALSFLVLPIVLHRPTREMLPRTSRSKMHVWIRENAIVRIGFARRASELVPYTREALVFGMVHNSLKLGPEGAIGAGDAGDSYSPATHTEARSCLNGATLVGKLFAAAGDAGTILVAWGVRP